MPEEERPRERLARLGAIALRDAELLAVLFRTGTREEGAVALAERLLSRFGNLRALSRASLEELMQVKGVGRVKAIEIQAAVGWASVSRGKDEERPRIHSATMSPDCSWPLQTVRNQVFRPYCSTPRMRC